MRIIEGKNVDLIAPFPSGEVGRMYGWMHCYRTLTEDDDSPKNLEEFIQHTHTMLGVCPSWGIVDKWKITNSRHEAPLVGVLLFEPTLSPWNGQIRNGQLHVATARKAWKTGLVDEASQLVISTLFDELPGLQRLSAYMLEKNFPAKGLARRAGFKFEGLVEDAVVQGGSPQSMALFGLTRRNYDLCHSHSPLLETPLVASQETSLVVEDRQTPLVDPNQLTEPSQAPPAPMDPPQLLDSKVV
jgi:RimJ/RimL family protein N-acetyltransferase